MTQVQWQTSLKWKDNTDNNRARRMGVNYGQGGDNQRLIGIALGLELEAWIMLGALKLCSPPPIRFSVVEALTFCVWHHIRILKQCVPFLYDAQYFGFSIFKWLWFAAKLYEVECLCISREQNIQKKGRRPPLLLVSNAGSLTIWEISLVWITLLIHVSGDSPRQCLWILAFLVYFSTYLDD